jgi:VanZ family protein
MVIRYYKIIFWFGYAAMLVASFLPIGGNLSSEHGVFQIRLDYLWHALVYFAVCLFFITGSLLKLKVFEKKNRLKFFLFMVLLATVSEVVQLWVPYRSFNIMDWLSNMTGLALGFVLVLVFRLRPCLPTRQVRQAHPPFPCKNSQQSGNC